MLAPYRHCVVLFGNETEALRFAVANGMHCQRVQLGESLTDQISKPAPDD